MGGHDADEIETIERAALEDLNAAASAGLRQELGIDSAVAGSAWLECLVDRPSRHIYMSFDGDTPAGAGALFVKDGIGWCDWGAADPAYRGRGGQAVIIAIVLMATDTRLPTVLDRTFGILGGLAIPLMLLTLGNTLATLKVDRIWQGCYLAVFHVGMAAVVAFTLTHLFGFHGTARGVFILQCMMPVSVATYLWVEMYTPERAADVAGFIFCSTLLSIIVLPAVMTFWV